VLRPGPVRSSGLDRDKLLRTAHRSEFNIIFYANRLTLLRAARIQHVAEAGDSAFGGLHASLKAFSVKVEPGVNSGGLQVEPAPVFVITNNHFEGKAIVNAPQLVHLLTGAKVKVPDSLRQHYPQLERIASEPPAEPLLFPT
jgi:hypothetical protein